MPLPTKSATESKDEFISRCISDLSSEYDQNQASAICYLQLRKVRMEETEPEIDPALLDQCMLDLQGINPSYSGAVAMKICKARLVVGARQRDIEDSGIVSPEEL
tara:strand:+ start:644 stop:958 length:315 start_codon:yes stop_codon:yes gene_type:complete